MIRIKSAATTNATSVKASSGHVSGLVLANKHAADTRYVKLYNKATAPTVGTDVPVLTIPIAAGRNIDITFPERWAFTLGIAYAITAGVADSDTTAVVADDVHGALFYS